MVDTTQAPDRPLGPFTRSLVRRLAGKEDAALDEAERRVAYGLVEGYVSIVLNLVLFGLKLALGILTGSIALVADAAHTAADSLTSVVVILAAYISRRPPDKEHPYGHGRSEAVGTIVIAVLLGVAGVEFGKESILRIWNPTPITAAWWVIGVVLATAAIKEWLARYATLLARRSGNRTLDADAWHHRSDVFATVLVALGMVGARFGAAWLDGAAGLLVSVLILKVAFDVSKDAIDTLLGAAPDPHEIERIKREAAQVEGVFGVHDVVVHKYGVRTFISLHIETSDQADADTLHRLASRVERRVTHSGHGSVCVHVDPINIEHPAYDAVRAALLLLVEEDPDAEAFHDLRLVGDAEQYSIVFDLKVPAGTRQREAVSCRLVEAMKERFPAANVVIEVDPEFSY